MALITYRDFPQNSFIGVTLPRMCRGVLIENSANFAVELHDDMNRLAGTVPPGLTIGWNFPEGLFRPTIGAIGSFQGYARAYFYDTPLDLTGNPPAQMPPGTLNISGGNINITGGDINIISIPPVDVSTMPPVVVNTLPPVQIAGGQSVNVGAITTLPPVQIAASQSVNVGAITTLPPVQVAAGQSVAVNNTTANPVPVVDPDIVAAFVTPSPLSNITLARRAYRLIIQPVLSTFGRGGLLSCNATDSTTQTYEFLESEPLPLGNLFPLSPIIPYQFACALKSGAVVHLSFTGSLGFIVAYQ